MMRTALILSSLLVAACTVGQAANPATVDAGTASTVDSGSTAANGCVDRRTPPDPAHKHTLGGTSNAGQSCVQSLCHLAATPGAGATPFQFAGTVYKPGTTTPSAGATIQVKSGTTGTIVAAYTDADGNFYISAGSLPQAFPATTDATACPTVTKMVSQVVQGGGDCNSCHKTGGAAGGVISIAD